MKFFCWVFVKEPERRQYVLPSLILGKHKTPVNVCRDVQQRASQLGCFLTCFIYQLIWLLLPGARRCPPAGLVPEMIPTVTNEMYELFCLWEEVMLQTVCLCLFVCLFVRSSFGRSAEHLTSHVTGTPPWRCLAVQSSSGTSQRVSAGTRGTRARRRQGRMSGTTTPCCTPCSSWPSCSETCWCVWPCWGSAPCRPPPTTWWSAWLWPTCW